MKHLILISLLAMLLFQAQAQNRGFLESDENSGNVFLISPTFSYQIPGGDLSDRFGNSLGAGLELDYLTDSTNWLIGLDGQLMFGNDIKEDVLANLRTDDGRILTTLGETSQIFTRQRMFYLGAHVGKLIPLNKRNRRAGLRVTVGAGYFLHKIRIQDENNSQNLFNDEFKKGFDRFTSGVAAREFIGYQFMSLNRLSNFFVGVEMMQGFTKNRRSFDYLERRRLDESRLDLTFGLRVGWTLAIFDNTIKKGDIYY